MELRGAADVLRPVHLIRAWPGGGRGLPARLPAHDGATAGPRGQGAGAAPAVVAEREAEGPAEGPGDATLGASTGAAVADGAGAPPAGQACSAAVRAARVGACVVASAHPPWATAAAQAASWAGQIRPVETPAAADPPTVPPMPKDSGRRV